MENQDEIQIPRSEILFRQSSVETRLSPVHLSEEEIIDDERSAGAVPKIISCKKKVLSGEENLAGKPLVPSKPTSSISKDIKQSNQKTKEARIDDAVGGINNNFRDELKKTLNKQKLGIQNTDKIIANQINNADNGDTIVLPTVNKNKDQFKDELNNKTKKIVGPPPPPRDTNFQINKEFRESLDSYSGITMDEEISEIKVFKKHEYLEYSVGTIKALKKKEQPINNDGDNTVGGAYQQQQRKEEMATLRPKSPRPVPLKGEKEETIWDKLGTLGRKKRIKEVQEVQAEGKYAIDSPGCPTAPVIPPEDYNLDDNEERCMIDPRAYDDTKFMDLLYVLKEWINDELASQRIIVQDLSEDLYDGQVLQKLLEKLTGDKLDVPEVTQSEEGQKQKLTVVLDHFNKVLGIQRQSHNKWNVESIHSKNIVAITHLLVALARHFRPPVRLPEHVSVEVVVVQKNNGKLLHKTVRESLTKTYDDVGMRCERDAFDTLFDHAPDKLQVVKKSLVTFVNKHLNKMNFEVTEIESQFHDGVYLIMLMGLLEGFFVPHYSFHLTPHEFEQKVHNVNFAFELMEETGLQKPKARPEDVVNMDLKSTLRVLYNLFLQYRTIL